MNNHRSFNSRSALKITLVAALAAVGGLDAAPALAGSAFTNLGVSATVANSCTVATTAVTFGTYDGVVTNVTAPLDSPGTVTVTCTLAGADVTVTLSEGTNKDSTSTAAAPVRRMVDGASHYMSYALYSDTGHSTNFGSAGVPNTPTGSAVDTTVYGRIAAGQNTLPAGNYTDTVVATVTF